MYEEAPSLRQGRSFFIQTERNDKERFRVGQLVVPPSEIELPSVVEEVSYSINQS